MDCLQVPPRAIIFDLGDVLFTWSATTRTTIPGQTLREILSSPAWYSYLRGEITRDVCYELIARQSSLMASEIAEAFSQARKSLQPNYTIISFLRELRKDPAVQVYAMSNIGKEDFEELATKIDWSLFDQVFTSASAGMVKPDPDLYRHVLSHINLAGNQVIFIDDKEENVHAARALGIQALIFGESTINRLRETFASPVGKGWKFLLHNAKHCKSSTDTGVAFGDNFSKVLISELLQDQFLIGLSWGSKTTWNFFTDERPLIPGGVFPDDLDTTAVALQVLRPSSKIVSSVLSTMVEYLNDDGTFQVYFDRDKVRVDPVVNANILACFYSYNRGHEFEGALRFVQSMLLDRSYMQGTRYYSSADCCLGFVGRLLQSSSDTHLQATLGRLLKSRVRERVGLEGSALDLAMRIITCTQMGVACEIDRRTLRGLQCEDGSWEAGWLYKYGSTGVQIGNRGVTTAAAVAALSGRGIAVNGDYTSRVDVRVDKDLVIISERKSLVQEAFP